MSNTAPPTANQVLTAASATLANWQDNIAVGLRTSSDPVLFPSAVTPLVNQVLTATSGTSATWQTNTASQLRTNSLPVVVSTSLSPSANQVLTATSSTNATWQNNNATALRTNGGPVNVSAASPPNANQVLIASSGTTAIWQTLRTSYLSSNNAAPTILFAGFREWHGIRTNVTTASTTFNVTTDGTTSGGQIFANLQSCVLQVSCRKNVDPATTITQVPFASIRSIDTNVVTVSILTPNSTSIVIGGTAIGMQANNTACIVYLSIFGQ